MKTLLAILLLAGVAVVGCKKEIPMEQRIESATILTAKSSYELGRSAGILAYQTVYHRGVDCSVAGMIVLADSLSGFYRTYDTTKIINP